MQNTSDNIEEASDYVGTMLPMQLLWLGNIPLNPELGLRTTFEGKDVLDYGAGLSGLGNLISKLGNPNSVTLLDPAYSLGKKSILEKAMVEQKKYMEIVKKILKTNLSWYCENSPYTVASLMNAVKLRMANIKSGIDTHLRKCVYASEIPDESKDIIFLNGLLYQVDNPDEILMEADRILRPNGMIIINDYTTKELFDHIEARMEIEKSTEQHYCVKLKKGEYTGLDMFSLMNKHNEGSMTLPTGTEAGDELIAELMFQAKVSDILEGEENTGETFTIFKKDILSGKLTSKERKFVEMMGMQGVLEDVLAGPNDSIIIVENALGFGINGY